MHTCSLSLGYPEQMSALTRYIHCKPRQTGNKAICRWMYSSQIYSSQNVCFDQWTPSHLNWSQIEQEAGISSASVCNWPGDPNRSWSDGWRPVIDDGGIEGHLTPNAPEITDCTEVSGVAREGEKLESTCRSDTQQEVKNRWSKTESVKSTGRSKFEVQNSVITINIPPLVQYVSK